MRTTFYKGPFLATDGGVVAVYLAMSTPPESPHGRNELS
jgi:hypothetical protein